MGPQEVLDQLELIIIVICIEAIAFFLHRILTKTRFHACCSSSFWCYSSHVLMSGVIQVIIIFTVKIWILSNRKYSLFQPRYESSQMINVSHLLKPVKDDKVRHLIPQKYEQEKNTSARKT